MTLEIIVAVLGAAHLYLAHFKDRRKVDSVVHIQERTEEAETLDFSVTLFQDETPEAQRLKMEKYFLIAEDRRARNNNIAQALFQEMQEKVKKLKA